MNWNVKVNENQYRDDNYRVTIGNYETLEIRKVGVGHMGSAQYGILDKECAEHVARGLRTEIEWSEHQELTDDLNDQINEVLEKRVEEWGKQTA